MIVVTGATGLLGRLVIEELKARVPAGDLVAAVRSPEKADGLGVEVREADYDRPETLTTAFDGADTVLLISGNEVGRRIPQHTAAVAAAKRAGVSLLAYTSAPLASTSALVLAPEHRATEEAIRSSGVPFTILRNNWYTENYEEGIRRAAETGVYVGSAGDGRVASATRADYAAAAAVVLTGGAVHEGRTYELSGDTAWTFSELAAEIGAAAGTDVTYRDLAPEKHKAALREAGLPEAAAEFTVTLEGNIADGLLGHATDELRSLIGRPTTPMPETVRRFLTARTAQSS